MRSYTVTHHKHGVIIVGPVSVDDYVMLIEMFKKNYDYHILAADISERFEASLAMTSDDNIGPWRKALGMEDK